MEYVALSTYVLVCECTFFFAPRRFTFWQLSAPARDCQRSPFVYTQSSFIAVHNLQHFVHFVVLWHLCSAFAVYTKLLWAQNFSLLLAYIVFSCDNNNKSNRFTNKQKQQRQLQSWQHYQQFVVTFTISYTLVQQNICNKN